MEEINQIMFSKIWFDGVLLGFKLSNCQLFDTNNIHYEENYPWYAF